MTIALPRTTILTRDEWGARTHLWTWNSRTRSQPVPMRLPVDLAYLHHSVTVPTSDPVADMRRLEAIGIDRFGRLSYSWAWHPSGVLLEGCGDWIGAHTLNRNSTSLGLVLIGNYQMNEPPARMVDDLAELIVWLQETGRLGVGTYPTTDHQGTGARTACAGYFARSLMPDIRAAVAGEPAPTPAPVPPPPPVPAPTHHEDYDMDLIDLTHADTHPVTGARHGDNLQGLLLACFLVPDHYTPRLVGTDGRPDNVLGAGTAEAVEAFQRAVGIKPDRVVGPDTWRHLIEF